jgi:tetratricopeptide (TPR) repeat protein
VFLDVLDAVAHAHANLVVHRDIKPSNVLVDRQGRVRLLDFGIAKLLEADSAAGAATALTEEGGRALTPEYASPEQVTGGPITTASDVYSLGVLLYALLSGTHPVTADRRSPAELIRAIVDTDPRRLSDAAPDADLRRRLRGDLETIVAKALKKKPEERYASVTALADDLRRWLRHEPIGARRDSTLYRLGKFVRRNRAAVTLSAAIVAALLAGLAGTITQARRATRQAALAEDHRNRANRQAAEAAQQRDFALRQLSLAEEALDLNAFVLTDAAAAGKPLAAHDLLSRAEEVAEREHAPTENHVAMLLSLGHQYLHQNENESARRLFSHAYEVASALPDRSVRGRAGCELAGVIVYFGETERAQALLSAARGDIPETPQYALYRARCLLTASDVARWRGDVDAAIRNTESARELLKRSTVAASALEISAALSLGESYRLAGRMHDARLACEDASARLEKLGRSETSTAGTLYNNWGLVLFGLGRPLEAERQLRRAVRLDGELEARPMLLNNLARTLRELRRLEEASLYAERALARARAAGDRNIVGQSLMALAGIYRERGDLVRAAAAQAELDATLPKLVPGGHVAFASLAMEHALLAAARGDLDGALSAANRAVAIADASKQRAEYLPRLLMRRSELELAARRNTEARSDAERALEMARTVAEPGASSAGVGRAQLTLARALRAEEKSAEARAAAASALAQLGPALGEDHPETREARRVSEGPPP